MKTWTEGLPVSLILLAACSAVSAETTLPPVLVKAPKEGGGDFECRGAACASALQAEQLAAHLKFLREHEWLPDEPIPIAADKFCPALKKKRPNNCSSGSPPSTPDFSPSWKPNGCGTGPMANWFLSRILKEASSQYSGNLDAPYRGISFLDACNAHDRCWGQAKERATCDIAFNTGMLAACSSLNSSGASNSCKGFAGLYHSVVSVTDAADEHYSRSVSAFQCAGWIHDMAANGCNR